MPGGVNAWRFQLAEEEEKRRRKFGWDDLFDLLNTAAGAYTGIKGVQEAGKRTGLMEDRLAFDREQAGIRETARQGTAMRGMEEGGYERVPTFTGDWSDPAKAAQMGGDMGRVHPDLGDTAWRRTPEVDPMDKELEDRGRLFEFLSGQLGEGQTLLPTTTGYRGEYAPGYGKEPDTPATLTPWQRGERIEGGWIPEEQITSYDLETQMPMVDGQPRPAVAGLVAPPEAPGGVKPITFTGANVVSLARAGADPFLEPGAVMEALPGAYGALAQLNEGGGLSLAAILAEFPDVTFTSADLAELERLLGTQGPDAVRNAILAELGG